MRDRILYQRIAVGTLADRARTDWGPITWTDTRLRTERARYVLGRVRGVMWWKLAEARERNESRKIPFSRERFLRQPVSACPAAAAILLHWIRTRCA